MANQPQQSSKGKGEKRVHRGIDEKVYYEKEEDIPKEMQENETIEKIHVPMEDFYYTTPKSTIMYSTSSGIDILQEFCEKLESLGLTMTLTADQWRWSFDVSGKIMQEQDEEEKKEYLIKPKTCKIQVDVSKIDRKYFDNEALENTDADEIVRAIEFTRMGGDTITFLERFKELKDLFKDIDNIPLPNFENFAN